MGIDEKVENLDEISQISQNLCKEVLSTIPSVPIIYGELDFSKIGLPLSDDENAKDEYIAECIKRKVIPHSNCTMRYENSKRGFIIDSYKIPGVSLNNQSISPMLDGGSPHKIRFKWGVGTGGDKLFFRNTNSINNQLWDNNYQLDF